jgi:hypothetical protein
MQIWSEWWSWIEPIRECCSRTQSFLWLTVAMAGISTRTDLMGVSSIVRSLGLVASCYDRLLDFVHSPATDADRLSRRWTQIVFDRLPGIVREGDMPVLLGDGIKISKRGRKMPGVKLLHQVSESNTKPEYIMGHSIQVVSILVRAAGSFFAVPLSARIHEGLIFSNRDQRTLQTKFLGLVDQLGVGRPFYLVADAYYACHQVALHLVEKGCHLISRVRKNTVAFESCPRAGKRGRGRPKLYGKKLRLFDLFEDASRPWQEAQSPVYGEKGVVIRYLCLDLLWKPIRRLARFVLVDHPSRGRTIFLCTNLSLDPIAVIRLYGLRFKIELSFKQAVRTLGVYAYHFWMMTMEKISRRSGDQYLHRRPEAYRVAVRRKISAYHRYIQIGLIAQGVLQCLAITQATLVWRSFGSWLCTIRPDLPPSELVVMSALRNALPEFLVGSGSAAILRKFLRDRIDLNRAEGLRLAG